LTFQWDFGDGSISLPADPTLVAVQHAFASKGTYLVKVVASKVGQKELVSMITTNVVIVDDGICPHSLHSYSRNN